MAASFRKTLSAIGIYQELTVIRLTLLVAATAFVGYWLAGGGLSDWHLLLGATLGTALLSGGANSFNQWMEWRRDALMDRTKGRPLPSGRMGRMHAGLFSLAMSIIGALLLFLFTHRLTTLLGLGAFLVYLVAYTPMKRRSPLNTLVGAISGALPPMMGWSAAANSLPLGAWILAAVLFFWQIPHFLALAWLYREDYERGGFLMLPHRDPDGRLTAQVALLYTLPLLPLGISLSLAGVNGRVFAVASIFLGVFFLLRAWGLYRNPGRDAARRLFLASVMYLPLLLIIMILDAKRPGL